MTRRKRRAFQTTAAEVLEDRALLTASLDLGFAGDGIASLDNAGFAVQVQPDGKILVGTGGGGNGEIRRYDDTGALDTSFGTGGIASIPNFEFVTDVEVQPDGKLIATAVDNSTQTRSFLARFEADGTLDPTFPITGLGFGQFPTVEIDSQGRLITLRSSNAFTGIETGFMNRFDADGTLDTSFGSNGRVSFNSPGLGQIEIDSSDRILVASDSLRRFNSDGTPDTSFSTDGVADSTSNLFVDVAIADDGTVYASGIDDTFSAGVVEAFDDSGNSLAVATTPSAVLMSVAVQPDGKVVVGSGTFGNTDDVDASILRYESDLTADANFGVAIIQVESSVIDIELDSTGRILASGFSSNDDTPDQDNFVARVLPGNTVPVAIDDNGTVVEDATPNTSTGNVLANDTDDDGDTLVVSEVDGSSAEVGTTLTMSFGTVVINADGSYTYTLDNSNADVQALNLGDTLTETISYTTDDGSGGSAIAELTITIAGADEPSGPVELVNGELLVNGMAGPDVVTISANNGVLIVSYSGQPDMTFNESDVDSIQVSLGDGDDSIRVDFTDVPAFIDGGAGDDFLEGSRGDDVFIGGAGNDTLEGFSGDDTLIGGPGDDRIIGSTGNDFLSGGTGSDTVFGGSGSEVILGGAGNDAISGGSGSDLIFGGVGSDFINAGSGGDILLGGSTNLSDNDLALVREEWTSNRSYTERVANLRTGSGPVLNGVQLNASTVFNDNSSDLLFGNSGLDWYIGSVGDFTFGRRFFEELDVI
jgi:uncharacterized delta-60 repeat protein